MPNGYQTPHLNASSHGHLQEELSVPQLGQIAAVEQ
jgi:hypothetical protein